MNELAVLLALEDLKRLKSRYFRGVDDQNWDLWRVEDFAPDASLTVAGGETVTGVEAIIAWVPGVGGTGCRCTMVICPILKS